MCRSKGVASAGDILNIIIRIEQDQKNLWNVIELLRDSGIILTTKNLKVLCQSHYEKREMEYCESIKDVIKFIIDIVNI
jgi:predicted nucleic-acid-binding protein